MTARRSTLAAAVMLCGGLWGAQAPAQTSDTSRLNAIEACSTIAKKSARLACYDAQSQGSAPSPQRTRVPSGFEPAAPAASAASVAAAAAPAAAAPVAVAPEQEPSFGGRKARKTKVERARETTRMIAHATGATDNGIGHWTITLDNGQAWKMSEASPNFAPPHDGDEVRIRKGALGGFLMDVNHQAPVSVVRIQ